MAETEELKVPKSVSLADEDRDRIEGLEEVVLGDHVKQELLVQAGDSEAIVRRLGQRTQASATYPAEEEDARNIAEEDIFEIEDNLREEREEAEKARAAEIEAEGEASAKAAKESAKGKSVTEQTMDEHKKATGNGESYPGTHAALDELAAGNNIEWDEETTVADKQERLKKEGVQGA